MGWNNGAELLFGGQPCKDAGEENEMLAPEANELINVLHVVHCDNSRLRYYAKRSGGREISIMPLTPFVYEYFLFNSLYQVDWEETKSKKALVFHPESDCGEFKKQKALLAYVKGHAKNKPADLYRALEPLLHIERAEGPWTKVTPDTRISESDGDKFFEKIAKLQSILAGCQTPSKMPTKGKMFDILTDCSYFIYMVRNNIFHGTKTLEDVNERNQKQRLEVYDLFLKGITSLFFLASGKTTAACDFVPCPIYSWLPSRNGTEIMDRSLILRATAERMMKEGDSRLVARFAKVVPLPPAEKMPSDKSALFYPSADTDFITPMLLGLPYCTQFFFFERSRHDQPPALENILGRIKGVQIPKDAIWRTLGERDYFDFEFNDIPRRLHWVHTDNKEMLKEDVDLQFYFHRGDSWGEGGSGQEWDSRLLPELLKLIPPGSSAIYLTDGEPGGLNTQNSSEQFELNLPFIGRERTYYCGRFSS